MAIHVHNTGEEYETKVQNDEVATVTSVDVGLFHDGAVSGDTTSGDDLADSDDIGAITTEPSGSAYGRSTQSIGTDFEVVQSGGDWQLQTLNQLSFDLSDDGSGTLDAYLVVISAQLAGDSSATDHLWFTGQLSTDYDLSQTNGIDIDAGGVGRSID